jgi:pyrroline-5-carboxylate reductase
MKTLGFIGGGRIVSIIIKGLIKAEKLPPRVIVYDSDKAARERISRSVKGIPVTESLAEAAGADIVIAALHPQAFLETAKDIASAVKKDSFVLSLVPKIRLGKTAELLGPSVHVARMNPNAPSLVNRGFNPVAYSPSCTADEKKMIEAVFGSLGEMPEVDDAQIEAFAVITAMGYTYLDYQCAELFELAKRFGIPADLASRGVRALFAGTAETVLGSGADIDVFDLVPARPMKDTEESMRKQYGQQLAERFSMLTK